MIKLLCKCGNIEELKNDKPLRNFKVKNCGDGTVVVICNKCHNTVFVKDEK